MTAQNLEAFTPSRIIQEAADSSLPASAMTPAFPHVPQECREGDPLDSGADGRVREAFPFLTEMSDSQEGRLEPHSFASCW